MKPMLDFAGGPSRPEVGRARRKRRKAVRTPKNPRVRSVAISQAGRAREAEEGQVDGGSRVRWVSRPLTQFSLHTCVQNYTHVHALTRILMSCTRTHFQAYIM